MSQSSIIRNGVQSGSADIQIVQAPGTITFDSTTTDPANTFYTLQRTIPVQELKLINYRIQFETDAEAITAGQIWVDLPFFSVDQLIDNNGANDGRLPLAVGGSRITLMQPNDHTVYMSKVAQKVGYMRIYDDSGDLLTGGGFERIQLTFEYKLTDNA